MFNGITTENSKQFIPTDLETDGEKGTDSRFFYSSGSASRSGGSSSDLELPYFSKNSKSASINSSSAGEVKTSKFTLEASKANLFDYNKIGKAKAASTPSTIKASAGSGDQLLGLKLGKRIYFEDACAGSHAQSSSVSTIHVPSFTQAKKLKPKIQNQHAPRCQVEVCNLDLSSAKDYHRKHRVCESHSKCQKVIVAGLERRFCQQCSR